MSYSIRYTTRFKKDLKLVEKQGKKLDKLFEIVSRLASGEQLEPKYRDHFLTGQYAGSRECHIEPDWLLIYEINEQDIILLLSRTGSNSDLF